MAQVPEYLRNDALILLRSSARLVIWQAEEEVCESQLIARLSGPLRACISRYLDYGGDVPTVFRVVNDAGCGLLMRLAVEAFVLRYKDQTPYPAV